MYQVIKLILCLLNYNPNFNIEQNVEFKPSVNGDSLNILFSIEITNNDSINYKYYFFEGANFNEITDNLNYQINYSTKQLNRHFVFTKEKERYINFLWLNSQWNFAGSDVPNGKVDSIILYPGQSLQIIKNETFLISNMFCSNEILFNYDFYFFKEAFHQDLLFDIYGKGKVANNPNYLNINVEIPVNINCVNNQGYNLDYAIITQHN